jgi:hypothetical protein
MKYSTRRSICNLYIQFSLTVQKTPIPAVSPFRRDNSPANPSLLLCVVEEICLSSRYLAAGDLSVVMSQYITFSLPVIA